MWVDDPAGFSTHKLGRLHHDYHRHPLFQLPELEVLANELVPLKQCPRVRDASGRRCLFPEHFAAHDALRSRLDRARAALAPRTEAAAGLLLTY